MLGGTGLWVGGEGLVKVEIGYVYQFELVDEMSFGN